MAFLTSYSIPDERISIAPSSRMQFTCRLILCNTLEPRLVVIFEGGPGHEHAVFVQAL